jgi:hypothetical protein
MYINLLFKDMPFGTTFGTGELEKLLSDLEISKNQLKICYIEENSLDQSLLSDLESPYFERRFPINLTVYYESVGSAQIEETIEYREHIYYHFYREMDSVFLYTLPGMSINGFIDKRHKYKTTRQHVEAMYIPCGIRERFVEEDEAIIHAYNHERVLTHSTSSGYFVSVNEV